MGKASSSTVTVHNGPVTVDADSTVEVLGLNDIKLTLAPTPLKTESKQELILPQPLKTESKLETKSDVTSDSKNAMTVDLKPVAMDVCLNTSTQLPTGQICQPVLDAPRHDLDGRRVLRPQPRWRVTHHPSGSSEEAGDRLAGTTERGRSRRWARTPSRPGSPGTRARLARAHQVGDRHGAGR